MTKPSLLSSQNNDSTATDNATADIIDLTLTNSDWRKKFIINNSHGEPYESHSATKKFLFKSLFHVGSSSSTKKLKITAFTISEYSNQKFNSIIKTLFCYQPNKKIKVINC